MQRQTGNSAKFCQKIYLTEKLLNKRDERQQNKGQHHFWQCNFAFQENSNHCKDYKKSIQLASIRYPGTIVHRPSAIKTIARSSKRNFIVGTMEKSWFYDKKMSLQITFSSPP